MQLIIQRSKLSDVDLDKYLPPALAFFMFSIPISNTLQSIGFVLVLTLLLSQRTTFHTLSQMLREPWVVMAGMLYAFVLTACLWSPAAPADALFVINKYSKLLFLPLLAVGFKNKKAREWGIAAFLMAMTLTCVVAFVKFFYPGLFYNTIEGSVFRNYIMTGHMTALAGYIVLYLIFHSPRPEKNTSWQNRLRSPWLLALLFVMFSVQLLFLSPGRTGYMIYFLLITLFLLQTLPKKRFLPAGVLLIFAALLMLNYNPKVQQGVSQLHQNWTHYQQGDKYTSIGLRLQFQQFAWKLFKESPWIGNGTGGHTYYFKKDDPVPIWTLEYGALREPHNQYLLILAEYGLLGFAVFCVFLLALMRACWQLDAMKALAFAVLLPFLAGCLSDSLLFYSASGYFVIAFLALCLGEGVAKKIKYSNRFAS